MLGDAVSFPTDSDDRVATILVGGVLTVLSVLVVPGVVLQGYGVRAMGAAARGERAAPSFTEWGRLLVDGAKMVVVQFVYGLVVLVPIGVLILVGAISTGATGPGTGPGGAPRVLLGLVGVGMFLLIAALGLLAAYFVPAATANYAIEGSFGAAFDVSTVVRGALTSEYAVGWVLAMLAFVVGGTIGSMLSIILVGIFVLFYVQVVGYYLLGRGFARGRGDVQTAW